MESRLGNFSTVTIANRAQHAALLAARRRPLARPNSLVRPRTSILDNPVVVILSASAVAYVFIVAFAFLRFLVTSDNPRSFTASDIQAAITEPIQMVSKEDFLNRVSFTKRRESGNQVNFVTRIITASGVSYGEASKLAELIVRESKHANVDPLFVTAVMKRESTFKNKAVSNQGATGLMQVMPGTAHFIATKLGAGSASRLTDPANNIKLGITYLKHLKASFRNAEHVLIAYNWGPANLSRALKQRLNIPTSTKVYARRIIRDHERWHSELKSRTNSDRYLAQNVNFLG